MRAKILPSLFLCIFLSCGTSVKSIDAKQPELKDTTISLTPDGSNIIKDSVIIEIESIFYDLSVNDKITGEMKYCTFEYKTGDEPHVDVFGSKFGLILADIKQPNIIRLMNLFGAFCKNCESDMSQYTLFINDRKFLVEGDYSIELNYSMINGHTDDIICLIYGNGRYILCTEGVKD